MSGGRGQTLKWCPATGQGAMGTNWSVDSSIWTWGRTSSLWGWRSTGTGCPEVLWILLLWRYSRPAWTQSCAACCRWPCFGTGVGLDDSQRSLPPHTILGFCKVYSILNLVCMAASVVAESLVPCDRHKISLIWATWLLTVVLFWDNYERNPWFLWDSIALSRQGNLLAQTWSKNQTFVFFMWFFW